MSDLKEANNISEAGRGQVMDDGISIMQMLHIIRIRFWIVIICVIAAIAGAVYYLVVTVPVYESTASALVSPITNANSLDSLLNTSSSSKIQTEVSLITSEKNLDEALSLLDLHSYVNYDGLRYDEFEHPITGKSLISANKVKVSALRDTNVVNITVSDSNPEFCRDLVNAIVQSYSEVLTNIAKNSKTSQRVFLENQIPLNEQNLADATRELADFKKESGIIQISEKNKILSANVSNLQLQQEPLVHQKVEQMALYESYLKELEGMGLSPRRLEAFSSESGIRSALDKIHGWYQEVLMYQALGLSEKDASSTSRIYVLSNSISTGHKDVLAQVNRILKSEVDTSDAIAVQIRSLYGQVVAQLLMIEENIRAIDATMEFYSNELASYPELERQAEELQRNVTVYQSLSVKLREMYEETKLLEAAISGYVTKIDLGTLPSIPVSPNKLMVLAAAVLIGGCLGVLITFYVNYKDVIIRDAESVRRILGSGIPELGWTPLLNRNFRKKHGNKLPVICIPDSFYSERISVIAGNTIYSTDSSHMKVFGVNSASKGEGKTSLVCNMAVSYAQMGKRVLLIDGDLRRPSVEAMFGLKRSTMGLSNLVVDHSDLLDVLIRPVEGLDNLHILPAGHVSKNPAMIFSSKVFSNFLLAARKGYDIVLVDSPPVSVSPEFASIVNHFDGIIMNIRAGITTKPELASLVDNLNLIGVVIVGFVFNGVIVSSARSSYAYNYTGGYSYSKSYGMNDSGGDSDLKVLFKSRRLRSAYRKVYESELKERDLPIDPEDLTAPVSLRELGLNSTGLRQAARKSQVSDSADAKSVAAEPETGPAAEPEIEPKAEPEAESKTGNDKTGKDEAKASKPAKPDKRVNDPLSEIEKDAAAAGKID